MKNWKTTLAGIGFGLLSVAGHAVDARSSGGPAVTLGNLGLSLGLAVIGAVAKDHNVTGGTVVQPSIPIASGSPE